MQEFHLFKIIQEKYLHVVCRNFNYLKMIWSLRNKVNNLKVTQYTDNYESYASLNNDKFIRVKK